MKVFRKKKPTLGSKVADTILSVGVPVILILLWELGVGKGYLKGNLTPAPSTLWTTFISLCASGKISLALSVSIKRVLTGFAIGSITGIIIGALMGIYHICDKALTILVSLLRPVPVITLVPIFILTMGIGEKANIAVIVVGAFWPSLINTYAGIHEVDEKLLELAYTYRIGKTKQVFRIVMPSAVSSILTGIRLGISSAWMSVAAAEMVGASSGIGYMIMYSREMAQPAKMYVYVIIIGLIGVFVDKILLYVQSMCNKKFKGITG